jgi:hypothetical protein
VKSQIKYFQRGEKDIIIYSTIIEYHFLLVHVIVYSATKKLGTIKIFFPENQFPFLSANPHPKNIKYKAKDEINRNTEMNIWCA